MFLTMAFFFSNPDFRGNQLLGVVWASVALLLLNSAFTVLNVPSDPSPPNSRRTSRSAAR
jgi:hypothetical protein